MIVSETSLPGVCEVEPEVFADGRGFFLETYKKSRYELNGLAMRLHQTNHTHSEAGTLRGLHYQLVRPQNKLVYVVRGEIMDVAVDIRPGSPNFCMWHAVVLSAQNHKQLFIPSGFAHGFCVLSDNVDLIYLLTDEYDPNDQYAIRWDDPDIGINWPINNPVLSARDRSCPFLAEMPKEYLPKY